MRVLLLCLIAFLAGSAHLHFHIGHGHIDAGSGGASKFNFGTIAAFLTWFGGAGYILSSWGRIGSEVSGSASAKPGKSTAIAGWPWRASTASVCRHVSALSA